MLKDTKDIYTKNVFNKFLNKAYFVNKKYDEDCIIENALGIELYSGVVDDWSNDENLKLVDIADLQGNITVTNNYYSSTTSAYTHSQPSASAVWNVHHSLGYKPSLPLIVSLTGTNMDAVVENVDLNNTTITFSSPKSGFAYFS